MPEPFLNELPNEYQFCIASNGRIVKISQETRAAWIKPDLLINPRYELLIKTSEDGQSQCQHDKTISTTQIVIQLKLEIHFTSEEIYITNFNYICKKSNSI